MFAKMLRKLCESNDDNIFEPLDNFVVDDNHVLSRKFVDNAIADWREVILCIAMWLKWCDELRILLFV